MVDLGALGTLLGLAFFQRSLLGGAIAALACAAVGVFVLLRKQAMVGHGIAHVSFGGVAVGKYMVVAGAFVGAAETFPLYTALVAAVAGMWLVTWMRRRGVASSDAGIGLITAVGFAIGLVVISAAGGFNRDILSYLFGDVTTIGAQDLIVSAVLGAVILAFFAVFYKEMLSLTFDEESARLTGVPVRALSVAFDLLVAFTIVLSIKVVGIVLVSALVVLPGLSAFQFRLSFRGTMVAAMALAVVSVVVGILLSALYPVATGGLIILVATAFLGVCAAWVRLGDRPTEGPPAPGDRDSDG